MLDLDLMLLNSPKRFQDLCARLVCREYPNASALNIASWDGGRDVVAMIRTPSGNLVTDCVWQAKFTKDLGSSTKKSIRESINALRQSSDAPPPNKWILCMPVDVTGHFHDWLIGELAGTSWEIGIWGRSVLLEKLERYPDIVEVFFYAVFRELQKYFCTDALELHQFKLDEACEWTQPDAGVLSFQSSNVWSPDLVLDIIVRNLGTVAATILAVDVEVIERLTKLHGLPGTGLLFSQITYAVSIDNGRSGHHRARCDPPLVVLGLGVERFKIRLMDTGYAWNGSVSISFDCGQGKHLRMPAIRLHT